ncbi:unnamed protein product, partial [Polarella glacialis]
MSGSDFVTGALVGAGATSAAGLALLRRYLQQELSVPNLIHSPVEERLLEDQKLLTEVKLLLRDYWPHPVLEFSGYISTAWSGLWAALPANAAPGFVEKLILK